MLLRRRGLCNKFFVEDDFDEATMAEYFSREDCSESSSSSNSDPEPCASSSTSSTARIQGSSTSTSGHKRPLPSILKQSSSIGVEDEPQVRQSTAHQSRVSRNYHHKSSSMASCSSSAGSKSVQFSHVIESHHECILGDHPSVEEGPPLTLAWKALFHETIPLPQPKEQEPHRHSKSKAKKSTKRSSSSSSRRPSTLSAPCHTQKSGSASTGEAVRRRTACERRAIVVEAAQTGGEPFGPPKRSIHSCMARIQKENRKIQKSRGMALQEYMLERDLEELERQLGRCPDGPEAGLVSLLK